MTIGILYPSSKAHPDIGIDFIDGLKSLIKKDLPDAKLQLLMEGVSFGGSEKEVYEKAEKLLRIDRADMLIAFVDLKVLSILEPLLYSLDKLMLVVSPGANFPDNWYPQPNIIHLTLHHAFLCRLTGLLAAQAPHTKAAMATSFFDCGYLHTAAMANSFTQHSGTITFNYVSNQSYNGDFNINQLTDFLSANTDTKKLLCVYDSLPAALFYSCLNKYKEASRLELFVSPMMLEERAISGLDSKYAFSINGHMPWRQELVNESSQNFTTHYQSVTKKPATIFSLLGWESGLVIQQILQQDISGNYKATKIIEDLKLDALDSPRGKLKLDAETNYYLAPVVRCKIKDGVLSTEIIPIEMLEQHWIDFTAEPAEGIVSGWTNTYLCY